MNILDQISIRLPCNDCGKTYEVPLSDVLLSHTMVRCGCPVTQETECPPVYQIRLFDRGAIKDFSDAWEKLADGRGVMEANSSSRIHNPPSIRSTMQHP